MEVKQITLEKRDWVEVVPAFQATLRALLGGYLDSPRRFLSVVRRPTNLRGMGRYSLGRVQNAIRELLRRDAPASDLLTKLDATIQGLLGRSTLGEADLAGVVAQAYGAADAVLEGVAPESLQVEPFAPPEPIEAADYRTDDADYLAPVLGLDRFTERALRQDLAGFYLHGSLATLDYAKDYSDFDTLMILKREVVVHPERLRAFLKRYRQSLTFLYQFDPLQHHGHIVVTEIDLAYYPNTFFPLPVLAYARSLGGPWEDLEVRYRDDEADMRAEFERVCSAFSRRAKDGYQPRDAYALKEFLSELMLLPALYCQCRGSPCYKKFSFDRARPDFSVNEWRVMAEATDVRSGWRHGRKAGGVWAWAGRRLGLPEVVKKFSDNPSSGVMAWALERVGRDYVERAGRLAEAMSRQVARLAK